MNIDFENVMCQQFNALPSIDQKIINEVWSSKQAFIRWPILARLLWDGTVRARSHKYPNDIKREARSRGIHVDSHAKGPAITSFLLANGERPPRRSNPQHHWAIRHIYNGTFSWPSKHTTLHAIHDGKHFTQSAGLVAVHPLAEVLADEYFYFTWLLRREAYRQFHYDPDLIFCTKIDEYGFKVQTE
jgi:hypothetical protein